MGIESIKSSNAFPKSFEEQPTSNKKAALIGAGGALSAAIATDTVSLGYKAHKYAAQNKEKGIDVKFKDGLKTVWTAIKENGNAAVQDGEVVSNKIALFNTPLNGKHLMAIGAVIAAGLGAALGVGVNHYKNTKAQ